MSVFGHLRPVAEPTDAERAPSSGGVTPPSRRGLGSASRFLTDVIVELGLVEGDKVEQAIESKR